MLANNIFIDRITYFDSEQRDQIITEPRLSGLASQPFKHQSQTRRSCEAPSSRGSDGPESPNPLFPYRPSHSSVISSKKGGIVYVFPPPNSYIGCVGNLVGKAGGSPPAPFHNGRR